MSGPPPAGGAAPAGGGDKPERPIGPDGKPIPGPDQIRQIQAERKMKAQQGTKQLQSDVDRACQRFRASQSGMLVIGGAPGGLQAGSGQLRGDPPEVSRVRL